MAAIKYKYDVKINVNKVFYYSYVGKNIELFSILAPLYEGEGLAHRRQ